ncbi:NAD-dependent epimerase/dehydratase family protein [Candidatus Woesearchaeota archaeon]|nr:NAD-dependent epimerase/dehydratase family protein [Candidatus Woesearchaeota archaeon]
MEKVLITGATGFIGANLTRFLAKKNFEVHILIRSGSSLWRLEDIKNTISIHNVDILDKELLIETVKEIKPNHIFHLAAYGAYPRIQTEEPKILETNVIGIDNLLQATLDIPYATFVSTGTSSEYGPKLQPIKESDILEPNTTYGASKACATLLCQHYARRYNKPITIVRPFSVYGYYETSFRLTSDVILHCLRDADVELGSGEQKRDYIFIEDMLEAYEKIMQTKLTPGTILNIGTGHDCSVKEIAQAIHSLINPKSKLIFGKKKDAAFDTRVSWKADITAIKTALKWEPRTSLDIGLSKTIEWFRKNIHLYQEDSRDLI